MLQSILLSLNDSHIALNILDALFDFIVGKVSNLILGSLKCNVWIFDRVFSRLSHYSKIF